MKDVKGDESCHEISIGIYQHLTIGNGFLHSTQVIRTIETFWGFDAQVDHLFKLHNQQLLRFLCSQKPNPQDKAKEIILRHWRWASITLWKVWKVVKYLRDNFNSTNQSESLEKIYREKMFFKKILIHKSWGSGELFNWAWKMKEKNELLLPKGWGVSDEQLYARKNINIWFNSSCFLFERLILKRADALKNCRDWTVNYA